MALICEHNAANPKYCPDEKRTYELADWKVSTGDDNVVFAFAEVLIAYHAGHCWNDAQDGVGGKYYRSEMANHNCQINLKHCDHQAEVREPTEIAAADNSGEDGRSVDEKHALPLNKQST